MKQRNPSPLIGQLSKLADEPLNASLAGEGFEVLLGGSPARWQWRQARSAGDTETVWQLQQIDGPLHAQLSLRLLPEHRAAQWRLRLENSSAEPVVLEEVRPLLVRFAGLNEPWRTLTAGGGSSENFYPPRAYRSNERLALGGEVRVHSDEGGLSSQRHLPLLLACHAQAGLAGFWCALEYSGHWFLTLRHIGDNPFVRGELRLAGLSLAAGESLDLPAAHLGFFTGGLEAGGNALRRYVSECIRPAPPTPPQAWPPVFYHAGYGLPAGASAPALAQQVARAAELGVEYWVLGAARVQADLPAGAADVRPEGLSNLDELAEAVRAAGMTMGLCLSIELAGAGSRGVANHPELFLSPKPASAGRARRLLDLSQPAARQWALELVTAWVERLTLGWLRLEYDADPDPFLRREPTGKLELAHYRGLYELLAELRMRHGGLIIESSAAGGRRLDLAMLRQCHLHWASEQTFNPDIVRHMLCRANRLLPGSVVSSAVAVHTGRGHDYGGHDALARFGSALGFAGDIAAWGRPQTRKMRRWVEQYKLFRPMLAGEYYAPLAAPATDRQWDAAQFVSPGGGRSAVLVWRMAGQTSRMRIPLAGLAPDLTYLVQPMLGRGGGRRIVGSKLLTLGLPVALSPHSAKGYVIDVQPGPA